jgi:hypothetical protein
VKGATEEQLPFDGFFFFLFFFRLSPFACRLSLSRLRTTGHSFAGIIN